LLHAVTTEKFLLIEVLLFMSGSMLQFKGSVIRLNEIFFLVLYNYSSLCLEINFTFHCAIVASARRGEANHVQDIVP
jgi:hypothetical protein